MTTEIENLKTIEAQEEVEIGQVLDVLKTVRSQNADLTAQVAALQATIANLPLSPTDAANVAAMTTGIAAKNAEMAAALAPVVPPAPAPTV